MQNFAQNAGRAQLDSWEALPENQQPRNNIQDTDIYDTSGYAL